MSAPEYETHSRARDRHPRGRPPRSGARLLLLPLFLALQAAAQPAPTPQDVRKALHLRDFIQATELTDSALAQNPDDPDWRLAQVNILVAHGQLTEALSELRVILKNHPMHRESRIREAELLAQLGRLTSAAASYHGCLNDFPDDADVRLGLGLVHLWLGRFAEAATWLEQAALERTTREAALYARIRLLTASGRLREAWQQSTELDRNGGYRDAELGLLRAGLLRGIGAQERTRELASRASLDPELKRRQAAFVAQLELRDAVRDAALAEVESFATLNPPDYDALLAAADVLSKADRRHEARVLYQRATQLTPERPEGWLGLARLTSRDGRLAGALATYRQMIQNNPESLEAWLGIVRTAQLMDDSDTAHLALARAHALAPGSAYVMREELQQALADGDLNTFRERSVWYTEAQPDDRHAEFWRLRLQALDREDLEERALFEALDPLQPGPTAVLFKIGMARGYRLDEWLVRLSSLSEGDLNRSARSALAEQLAVLLQPQTAQAVAAEGSPEHLPWLQALIHGWWAYGSTPLAHGRELEKDFDPQALTVWLAAQLQQRFRSLYVETGSPIWNEWLLARAQWFAEWAGHWQEPAAAAALRGTLLSLSESWTSPPSLDQIDAAWQASETSLPPGNTSYAAVITRARWRLYRHDPDGALTRLREAQLLEPSAAEPAQRQAEALVAAGRTSEAARILHNLCLKPDSDPGLQLQYTDVLRRLHRPHDARAQLRQLLAHGFTEPGYYQQQALLAEAEGQVDGAREWYHRGLDQHPRAPTLFSAYADWLLREHREDLLVQALAETPPPPWNNPEHIAAVAEELPPAQRQRFLLTPRWWFSWKWLAWQRLPGRSSLLLQSRARDQVSHAALKDALQVLQPALDARLPDSELWLQGARLLDINQRHAESGRAFRLAMHLGCGRLDAEVLRLARESYRQPQAAAREFARRLEQSPEQRPLRIGLVQALLQSGEINAAARALNPLIVEDPDDPETLMLAAQLKAAQGKVRQARSLHDSLIRMDPLAPDPRAARRGLHERNDLGVALGYEVQTRQDTTVAGDQLDDWQEGFVSGFWRRPHPITRSLEYRWYERSGDLDHQLSAAVAAEVGRSWILHGRAAVGIDADYTSQWRLGAGASRALSESLYVSLNTDYLRFTDLNIWQFVPGVVWRWHPRGTAEGRIYVGANRLDSGTSEESLTGLLNLSWQLGSESLAILHGAWGDENAAHPTSDLIGNDSFQSYGLRLRLAWRHRWTLEPAYRFERHERFDLHAVGLSLGYSY